MIGERRSDSQYDILFNTGRGIVELYNPEIHGEWEIIQNEYGKTKYAVSLVPQVVLFEYKVHFEFSKVVL